MHKALKRFGQNFLIDKQIIGQIIQVIAPHKYDNIVEIGPGFGAITLPLLSNVAKLNVIEIDNNIVNFWHQQSYNNLIINHTDVLDFNFDKLGDNLKIVGNLPYNISSPIIVKMIAYNKYIDSMVFMLQQEVAQRLVSTINNKSYGRLSVIMQTFFKMELVFYVPAKAFNPAPKVQSAIVFFQPRKNINIKNIDAYYLIIKTAFAHKRKTLNNCMKQLITQNYTKINLNLRAENLTIQDFMNLTEDYVNLRDR